MYLVPQCCFPMFCNSIKHCPEHCSVRAKRLWSSRPDLFCSCATSSPSSKRLTKSSLPSRWRTRWPKCSPREKRNLSQIWCKTTTKRSRTTALSETSSLCLSTREWITFLSLPRSRCTRSCKWWTLIRWFSRTRRWPRWRDSGRPTTSESFSGPRTCWASCRRRRTSFCR